MGRLCAFGSPVKETVVWRPLRPLCKSITWVLCRDSSYRQVNTCHYSLKAISCKACIPPESCHPGTFVIQCLGVQSIFARLPRTKPWEEPDSFGRHGTGSVLFRHYRCEAHHPIKYCLGSRELTPWRFLMYNKCLWERAAWEHTKKLSRSSTSQSDSHCDFQRFLLNACYN